MAILLSVSGFYFYNMVRWGDFSEHGFLYRSGSGLNIVGNLNENGRFAGLFAGDQVLKINGKPFSTLEERRSATNYLAGEKNVFLVERDGKQFEVIITNNRLGFKKVFVQSGLPFLAGLSYILIGVLVFLMKPHRQIGWVFYLFGACVGSLIIFLLKSGLLWPSWLGAVNLFAFCFAPATVVHLMLSFPARSKVIDRHSWNPVYSLCRLPRSFHQHPYIDP